MNEKERTLDEVLNELGECTLEWSNHKVVLKDSFSELLGEARTIGEKMQTEIDRLNIPAAGQSKFISVHAMLLGDDNYISFPVVISGTKRGDVKIPVIGCGVTEQGKYITLKLGSLSFRLPIDFDVEGLGV